MHPSEVGFLRNEAMEVRIKDIINSSSAISNSEGKAVYEFFVSHSEEKDSLYFSFENLEDCTTAFLNASLGNIFLNFQIVPHLKNVNPFIQKKIERVMFNVSPERREIIDSYLREAYQA